MPQIRLKIIAYAIILKFLSLFLGQIMKLPLHKQHTRSEDKSSSFNLLSSIFLFFSLYRIFLANIIALSMFFHNVFFLKRRQA